VLEDVHWADEATLDVLRLLGRRLDSVPALVIATYRDDELDRGLAGQVRVDEPADGCQVRLLAPAARHDARLALVPEPVGPLLGYQSARDGVRPQLTRAAVGTHGQRRPAERAFSRQVTARTPARR